jgi:predicted dehydrogenase
MSKRATLIENRSIRTVLKPEPVENPIRLGLVGLGHRGVLNVLPKALAFEDYKLCCVCDIRKDITNTVVSDVKEKHNIQVRGYTDFNDMLKCEELDAVAILIDPDKQVPLACQAMEAGLHVMMEVPVAYTIEDCWKLVTTVERTGKVFLLMEQIRYTGYVQAWRQIVKQGVIGKPIFAEGEYFSNKPDAYYQDDRGVFYSLEQAQKNEKAKPTWRHKAPTITYLPHELSPLLHILDDRVVRVTAMSIRNKSYKYKNLERADIQVALMHTEKDSIMRLAVSHSTPQLPRGELYSHWHHIKGTDGVLEWMRSDKDLCKLWVDSWQLSEPIEIPWSLKRTDAPMEAMGSGHGDADYYVFAVFADAVLRGIKPEFDVYKAVESAAPAILAAESIADNNNPRDVPDFRPGPHRKLGEMPI